VDGVPSSSVDPVTEAAVIAASATAVVAVVGLVVNAWATTRTLRAARDLAHDQRLWDKRAGLYAEVFAYAGHRQDVRAHRLSPVRYGPEREALAKSVLDSYQQPSWYELQGRVLAFSSDEVGEAFIDAHAADERMWSALIARQEAVGLAAADPAAADPQAAAALGEEIKVLRQRADEADAALLSAIRRDLQARPRGRT
jgi:hypothetical protein